MKRIANFSALAGLTAAVVLLGTGCDLTDDPVLNHTVFPVLLGSEIFNVCVPISSGFYTRYTVAVNSDGTTTNVDEDSSASRSDCDYSVDTADQVDPSALQASESGQSGPRAQDSSSQPFTA